MKKLILGLMLMMSLTLTSCVTSVGATTVGVETITYYDDYLYLGNYYPVVYVDAIPYYFYKERWIIVPNNHYRYIRHYSNPLYFRGHPHPHWSNRNYTVHNRPHYYPQTRPNNQHGYNRPPVQHRPNTQPTRPNPHTRPGGNINHGNTQRPMPRGGYTPQRGGRR